ncbi:cadherin-like protein 26 isoform X2 [Rhineura floridana]|uniref:cadherin-like protein 26 isoform X2 n=1 Tax=Rhineura floridana TaxID=261503 RepID=UPI002AC7E67E|nr:cadherin-like protein 26 isoform X2 [Rhineura floridana]
MPIRSGFFPAAARPRISRAVPLLLAVLAINCFHHALGDNGSLRKTTHKRSSQDLKLQDSLRPLRRTKRRWVITTLELEEEDKGPFPKPIGELFNDVAQDMSVKYLISGPGVDEYPEVGLFSIEDDANGHVYVHRSIDRERNPSFTIRFDVANRMSGEIVDRSLLFNVKIKDVNDNAPEFPKKEFSITMKENHNRDEPVFNVTAFDKDEEGTPNSRVAYSLVLQTPNPKEPVFTIDSSSGQIRVTGCSHYETARAFRLLIKATDHGNPRLSSTATINIAMEDSNNNMPVFVKENYHLDVPEGKTEHGILRLSVEDKDSPSTPAWRAKYEILGGDVAKNFIIETDPNTNEGVLSIAKPLIYDKNNERRLVISVENEEPLSLCERGRVQSAQVLQKAYVNINIIDENDAPQFHPTILVLRQEEGMMPGTRIVQYTARDPDTTSNIIRYKVASDPDGWVTVDENSGIVTTVKMLDRESPHVNNSLYTIVIHAIDDGDSVELFMLKNLPAGNYSVQLHILDKQGLSRDQSLHVRVCRCLDGITCEQEMKLSAVSVGLGGGAIAAILSGVLLLLLALALLLWCSLTSEREKGSPFIPYEEGNQTLIHYNEESQRVLSQDTPDVGDPAISSPVYAQISKEKAQTMKMASGATTSHSQTSSQVPYEQNPSDFPGMNHGQAKLTENSYHPGGSIASPVTILEDFHPIPGWHQQVTLLPQSSKMHWKKPHDRILEMVGEILNQKRDRIASLEDNMVSYCPHVYAAEGKLEKSESFWSLPVVDDENNSLPPDFLETLGPKFTNLGRICSK